MDIIRGPKEHPMLFGPEMVRAIGARKKRQTRRPCKLVNKGMLQLEGNCCTPLNDEHGPMWRVCGGAELAPMPPEKLNLFSRIKVGDRIWVRETWSPDHADFYPHFPIVYRADYEVDVENGQAWSPEANRHFPFKWRPSIHMPRTAARFITEVTAIRVERLQTITVGGYKFASDVQLEGCPFENDPGLLGQDEADWFIPLWDSMYAAKGQSWNDDPWVWVYEFTLLSDARC